MIPSFQHSGPTGRMSLYKHIYYHTSNTLNSLVYAGEAHSVSSHVSLPQRGKSKRFDGIAFILQEAIYTSVNDLNPIESPP